MPLNVVNEFHDTTTSVIFLENYHVQIIEEDVDMAIGQTIEKDIMIDSSTGAVLTISVSVELE